MNYLLKLLIFVFLITAGMSSCQKEPLEIAEPFDVAAYSGRYDFNIQLETVRDGVSTVSTHESVGYVTKENDYTVKVLFDYAAPKVNCVYEYVVKSNGSFFSTYRGAGERIGHFENGNVLFEEVIDLGDGNFKHLDFIGIRSSH